MTTKLILLIDHEDSIRELLQACLSDVGKWSVMAFATIREGLDQIMVKRPDAILLDASTSETDGFLFTEQLKQYSRAQIVPIVLLSARANWFTSHQLQQMGVIGAIAKPFNPQTLPSEIANLLDWNLER